MEEITGHEDFINASTAKERIAELEAADCDGDLEGTEGCDSNLTCPSCYGDAGEELAALKELLEDFRNYPDRAFAIRDSFMEDYAMEEGDDLGGVGLDHFLFTYVNWKELASDLRSEMEEIRFRGTTYFITC
jgi:hypothetical protein